MKRGNWIVRMRCDVTKELICNDCTEEEIRKDPWECALEEHEVDQQDWEILKIEANE